MKYNNVRGFAMSENYGAPTERFTIIEARLYNINSFCFALQYIVEPGSEYLHAKWLILLNSAACIPVHKQYDYYIARIAVACTLLCTSKCNF